MRQRVLLAIERHAVYQSQKDRDPCPRWHRGGRSWRRRIPGSTRIGRPPGHDHDKTIVLPENQTGDFEQFKGATRGPHRFHQCGKSGIVGIKRDIEVGAQIGPVILRGARARPSALATTLTFRRSPAPLTLRRALVPGRPAGCACFATWAALGLTGRHRASTLSSRTLKHAPIPPRLAAPAATRSAVAPPTAVATGRTVALWLPSLTGHRLDLGPLRPKPEVLQLAEIDFVETLSWRLFGRRIVHGRSEKRAAAREKTGRFARARTVAGHGHPRRQAGELCRRQERGKRFPGDFQGNSGLYIHRHVPTYASS